MTAAGAAVRSDWSDNPWYWGGACVVLLASTSWLSSAFQYERATPVGWTIVFVGLMLIAGVCFLFAVRAARLRTATRFSLLLIFIVGFLMRAVFLVSTPILEDDHYRFLWDGAVAAQGVSPYKFSPASAEDSDSPLAELAGQSQLVHQRINYPHLRTVYPPVAQAFFVVSHWLRPWSLEAWRAVLVVAEGAVFVLLIALVRRLGVSHWSIVVYWWNPLVAKEAINSAHMESLLIVFLLMALLFCIKRRFVAAFVTLALAVGVKLWPVLLFPLIYSMAGQSPARRLGVAVFFLLLGAQAALVGQHVSNSDSGFSAYLGYWEMNDGLFMVVNTLTQLAGRVLSMDMSTQLVARLVVAGILLAVSLKVAHRTPRTAQSVCRGFLVVAACVFLLSPTQFPWYCAWLVALLAIVNNRALLLMSVLMPIYYLRFVFELYSMVELYDNYIVWLQYLPVFVLLAFDSWDSYSSTQKAGRHA